MWPKTRLYFKTKVYSMSRNKSVTLTISENIPKPRNKFWMLCIDAWENLHQIHICLGQGLGVSVQLKKFQSLFRGFGIFSEIVRVTLFFGTYCMLLYEAMSESKERKTKENGVCMETCMIHHSLVLEQFVTLRSFPHINRNSLSIVTEQ